MRPLGSLPQSLLLGFVLPALGLACRAPIPWSPREAPAVKIVISKDLPESETLRSELEAALRPEWKVIGAGEPEPRPLLLVTLDAYGPPPGGPRRGSRMAVIGGILTAVAFPFSQGAGLVLLPTGVSLLSTGWALSARSAREEARRGYQLPFLRARTVVLLQEEGQAYDYAHQERDISDLAPALPPEEAQLPGRVRWAVMQGLARKFREDLRVSPSSGP